ncbi:hypothetical protein HGRIS_009025 [Hohenbuehelia grisea]|uniref:Uncharacterized protein n=1 Tax=Hohenbuehelia grisea TaxID=104357 RepID=A0ABR3IZW7_9AGAR
MYGVKTFPSDNTKLAEMEFYLVDDLECDLTVFHPYRTLLSLCKKDHDAPSMASMEAEAGEVGAGIGAEDGPRYWGTGEGQLELPEGALQTAWFILNDTYRSSICLLYPPHLIAIAAIYLTFILHDPTRKVIAPHLPSASGAQQVEVPVSPAVTQPVRRSSRQAHQASAADAAKKPPDPISFLAELNVSLPLVATIAQEIITLYHLWERYREDAPAETGKRSRDREQQGLSPFGGGGMKRRSTSQNTSGNGGGPSNAATPADGDGREGSVSDTAGTTITPGFLSGMLLRMREAKLADMSHPASGRPNVAVNKMLERTQAAG